MKRNGRFPFPFRSCAGRCHRGSMPVFPAALALLLSMGGCSGVKPVCETIYEAEGVRIRLVGQLGEDGTPVPQGNEHPWEVDAKTLDALLGSIHFKKIVVFFKGKEQDAFPLEQRARMLLPLQQAFAKAGPNQWVDFSFRYRRKWVIVSRELLTDGELFRKDGKLNCAFRNLGFEAFGDPDRAQQPFRGNPTEEAIRDDWVLVVGAGQNLSKVEKPGFLGPKEFPNWIQLDLARQWPSPGTTQASGDKGKGVGTDEPAAAGAAQGRGAPVEKPPSPEEIDKQIQFLEELHKEGAISGKAYKQKMKALQELREKSSPSGK